LKESDGDMPYVYVVPEA